MLSILLYGISILFTPGPVTMLSMNQGFNRRFKETIGFFISIGVATFSLFIIYGYTGEQLIKEEYLIYISILGGLYILYLSYKVFTHNITIADSTAENSLPVTKTISFKDGFIMQFINPKASLAALPLATISFPANNITGINIFLVSCLFLVLGILAPALYCFIAQYFSKFIHKQIWLNLINKSMALVLSVIALNILYEHVFIPLHIL